ncbi:hypothetical protein VULLAG_LOCUS19312 [Vulpes lagopus]
MPPLSPWGAPAALCKAPTKFQCSLGARTPHFVCTNPCITASSSEGTCLPKATEGHLQQSGPQGTEPHGAEQQAPRPLWPQAVASWCAASGLLFWPPEPWSPSPIGSCHSITCGSFVLQELD